jgi:parallel beta-helix repeat protein
MGMRTMRKRPILLSLILASVALCELIPAISAGALVESAHSTPGCKGVTVTPSDDVQAMLDTRPTGTKFCFQAGEYVLKSFVVPKSFDRLIGLPGAVLTGLDTYAGGIKGYGGSTGQHDVTVRGFIIEHFLNPWTPGRLAPIEAGWNWTIENNEVRYNSQGGVEVSNGSIVRGNNIHHNGRIGITGSPVRGIRIRRNEIAFNNTGAYAGGHEGGVKVVGGSAGSFNLVFRGNQVHDNTGIGLWVDTNVRRVTVEMNTVENNSSIGIFYETSFDATIRNNTLRNNASDYVGKSCFWGAQIHVNDSQGVEIYGNTVDSSNGSNGICAVDIDRTVIPSASAKVANLYVHDNVVRMRLSSTVGLVGRSTAYRNSAKNRFAHNAYYVSDKSSESWAWSTYPVGWRQWRRYGNDRTGSLRTW